MRTPEQIVSLWRQRRDETHPLRTAALEVRSVANNDFSAIAFPMPELLPGQERMAVANMLVTGLNGSAQRITLSFPNVTSLALKKGQDRSESYASIRRRAALGWVEMNHLKARMPRRARYMLAHSSSPVMIRPDAKRRIPRWQVRDPLSTYPAQCADVDDVEPPDCIFAVQRNLAWLREEYPEKIGDLNVGSKATPEDLLDVIEYVDADQICVLVVGRQEQNEPRGLSTSYSGVGKRVTAWSGGDASYGRDEIVVLEDVENRRGKCTAIVPWRITLDLPVGQYDTMIGKMWWQARLSSLELIAVERGIYPSEWVIYPAGGDGKIIVEANGREGVIGEIEGGQYQVTQVNPGYKTNEAIDRLERASRLDGSVPAEYGGESPTNVRTDRRGLSVLGNEIDFNHAEVQTVFERSLEAELECATDIARAYFDAPRSFFVNWKGAKGPVDYTPSTHFEPGSRLSVKYAAVGVDSDTLSQVNMQKVGANTMSRRTAMEMDDTIDDVDEELDQIDAEQMRMALRDGYATRLAAGQLPEVDAARVIQLRLTGMSLEEAIIKAHEEAQARQATPVAPGSPEAQPGLAAPGAGAEAGGGVPFKPADVASLLAAVKVPGRTVAA